MKFFYLLLFFIILNCTQNNTISVEKATVQNATTEQINTLPLTEYYVKNYYYWIATREPSKRTNSYDDSNFYKPIKPKNKIAVSKDDGMIYQVDEEKFQTVEQQRKERARENKILRELKDNYEKFGKKKIEKEQDSIADLFAKKEKQGIIGTLSLKNNTKQSIEYAKITTLITYTFPNQKFYYSYPLEILKYNEIWKSDEMKNIDIPNIFNYAFDFNKFQKTLNIHKAEEIKLEYYIAFSNTIGLKNFTNEYYYEELEVPNRSIALLYGVFHKFPFTEKTKKMLGEKIFEKNITDPKKN